jgi:hypothetical protein
MEQGAWTAYEGGSVRAMRTALEKRNCRENRKTSGTFFSLA